MASKSAERMAAHRARQRAAGLVHLTLAVPAEDVALFTAMAKERRERRRTIVGVASQGAQQWFSAVVAAEVGAPPERRRESVPERAERLADVLLRSIVSAGWPVGRPLAAEAELLTGHGVSRAVLRHALRLLVHHGVVAGRRDVPGRLVVGRPEVDAVVRAASVYLEYLRIGPAAILFTRKTLELAALRRAIDRLDADGEERLRREIADEAALDENTPPLRFQRFHRLVGELSDDPALQLFGGVVLALSEMHSGFPRRPAAERRAVIDSIRRFHHEIAAAMIARDAPRALRRLDGYFEGMQDWMS